MAKKSSNSKSARPSELISGPQRLNRVLAAAGLGSRRDVEQLIVEGRVEVDGKTVTDLACKVDPKEATIEVDGTALRKHRPVYYILNKPSGVLSTNHDPSGRMRVIDLVPSKERIFPVGRLDSSSEGLMLLTNDGELAQRLAHPKYGVQKTYFVVVQGVITHEDLAKLRKGIYLADGVARIDGAKIRRQRKTCTEIEIILSEGKNREIRRILARVGHKVVVLRRLAIGPLRLGQLPVGQTRIVTSSEVEALYAATTAARAERKDKPRPGSKPGARTGTRTGTRGGDTREGRATGTGVTATRATGTRATGTRATGTRATTGTERPRPGARDANAPSSRSASTPLTRTPRSAPKISSSIKVGSVLTYDDAPANEGTDKPRRKSKPEASATNAIISSRTGAKSRSTARKSAARSAKPTKSAAAGTRRRGKSTQG